MLSSKVLNSKTFKSLELRIQTPLAKANFKFSFRQQKTSAQVVVCHVIVTSAMQCNFQKKEQNLKEFIV